MSELIVVGYEDQQSAEAARTALYGMSKEYLVELSDAVVAVADKDGKVSLNQMVNMWTLGASGGAFWGLLVGLLFLHPVLGVAVGAAAGGLSGGLTDYGINDDFMKDVSSLLKPGQAALFMMSRNTATDRVIAKLGEYGGHILRTNLDTVAESHARAVFDKVHADLTAGSKGKEAA